MCFALLFYFQVNLQDSGTHLTAQQFHAVLLEQAQALQQVATAHAQGIGQDDDSTDSSAASPSQPLLHHVSPLSPVVLLDVRNTFEYEIGRRGGLYLCVIHNRAYGAASLIVQHKLAQTAKPIKSGCSLPLNHSTHLAQPNTHSAL
jgi:hypothetical protein